MVEAAEAAKEFELCLARSLGLCHTAGNTIAHDVLDVDTAVSSSASFKQKSTVSAIERRTGCVRCRTTHNAIIVLQVLMKSRALSAECLMGCLSDMPLTSACHGQSWP